MILNEEQTRIGELNGKWSVLFRALLSIGTISLPLIVWLNVWFVSEIYEVKMNQIEVASRFDAFIALGPRYTPEMSRSDNLELKQEILEEIKEDYPPDWLWREVESNKKSIEIIEQQMRDREE